MHAVAALLPLLLTAGPAHFAGVGKIDKFEVLDVSLEKGWAALKLVSHSEWGDDDMGNKKSIDCRYPGMQATPLSGVQLALWDLKKGTLGPVFTIYREASAPEECSKPKDNEKALADAKAAIAEKGLDLTKKPKPLPGPPWEVPVGAKKVTVQATSTRVDNEEDGMSATRQVRVKAGKKTLFSQDQTFQLMGAGHLDYGFEGAWAEDGKVVVLLSITSGNMRAEETHAYFFTAIADLSK